MEITTEEIQKKFESLPEDLKWAIMAVNVDEKVTEIGKTYGLNIEQLGQLSLETHMVILDYTHPEKFEESLKASLNLPDEKNREIVMNINDKILREIKENLMSKSGKTDDKKNEEIPQMEESKLKQKEKFLNKEEKTEDEEETIKNIQNKKIMDSVSSQKLFGSFQTPTIKTEYSLNNISKNQEKTGTSANQNVKIPLEATIKPVSSDTKSVSPSYSIKEDPYRLKPE
ncbi:MAG: hypothetical protein AAB493_02750 [Patescibacteria group bacterium]